MGQSCARSPLSRSVVFAVLPHQPCWLRKWIWDIEIIDNFFLHDGDNQTCRAIPGLSLPRYQNRSIPSIHESIHLPSFFGFAVCSSWFSPCALSVSAPTATFPSLLLCIMCDSPYRWATTRDQESRNSKDTASKLRGKRVQNAWCGYVGLVCRSGLPDGGLARHSHTGTSGWQLRALGLTASFPASIRLPSCIFAPTCDCEISESEGR